MADVAAVPNPLRPTPRRLYGPGPTNVAPSVIGVMQQAMLGHLDAEFHEVLAEVVAMLRAVYRMPSGVALPLSAPGTAGMEAGMTSLVNAGDTVVVGVAGFFGERMAQAAHRRGARVVEVRAEPGDAVPNDQLVEAIDRHPETSLVAVVHAETSTGVRHPLPELAAHLRGRDVLLMADCVTSLGGIELDAEHWGVDYGFSCTQKCVGAPPGMSPIVVSERALERIRQASVRPPLMFDLDELAQYWIGRPVKYHHTVPVLQIYALHEALRLVCEEGLEARWRRHADAGGYLQDQLRQRGFDLLADPAYQLPQLSAVKVPQGVDGLQIQRRLVRDSGIEIGGPLGPSGPRIWRIGLMGVNATRDDADRALAALDDALAAADHRPAHLAATS
ncbi:MAG: pyridoxal-phosphate-dependent aminotransferase family protein [Streptomycetales bacterium]